MQRERWRAWLGTGDDTHLAQVDVAEFASCAAARDWVEESLVAGPAAFGPVDRLLASDALDHRTVGLDADLVDGRVRWREAGR